MTTDRQLRKINRHVTDLAISFTHGRNHGPGLYVQIKAALGDPNRDEGGESSSGSAPGSQPPGWRVDVSDLLATMDTTVADWLVSWGHLKPPSTARALRFVPDLAPDDSLQAVLDALGRWNSMAQVSLGYRIPSRQLPETACRKRVLTRMGYRQIGCGATMLRAPGVIERDDDRANVWCSNPECHDSLSHPDCVQAEDKTWKCRDGDRDLTHCIRWATSEFGGLYALQQAG